MKALESDLMKVKCSLGHNTEGDTGDVHNTEPTFVLPFEKFCNVPLHPLGNGLLQTSDGMVIPARAQSRLERRQQVSVSGGVDEEQRDLLAALKNSRCSVCSMSSEGSL